MAVALTLTDEDLDRLSEVTEQDIIDTQNFATKALDREFKNLLLTVVEDLDDT